MSRVYYRHCLLGQGERRMYSWLEERGARVGYNVEILDAPAVEPESPPLTDCVRSERPTKGEWWTVLEVGDYRMTEHGVGGMSAEARHWRNNSSLEPT